MVVFNNGAAGIPNLRGESYGLLTRVSVFPDVRARPLQVGEEAPTLSHSMHSLRRAILRFYASEVP